MPLSTLFHTCHTYSMCTILLRSCTLVPRCNLLSFLLTCLIVFCDFFHQLFTFFCSIIRWLLPLSFLLLGISHPYNSCKSRNNCREVNLIPLHLRRMDMVLIQSFRTAFLFYWPPDSPTHFSFPFHCYRLPQLNSPLSNLYPSILSA